MTHLKRRPATSPTRVEADIRLYSTSQGGASVASLRSAIDEQLQAHAKVIRQDLMENTTELTRLVAERTLLDSLPRTKLFPHPKNWLGDCNGREIQRMGHG